MNANVIKKNAQQHQLVPKVSIFLGNWISLKYPFQAKFWNHLESKAAAKNTTVLPPAVMSSQNLKFFTLKTVTLSFLSMWHTVKVHALHQQASWKHSPKLLQNEPVHVALASSSIQRMSNLCVLEVSKSVTNIRLSPSVNVTPHNVAHHNFWSVVDTSSIKSIQLTPLNDCV